MTPAGAAIREFRDALGPGGWSDDPDLLAVHATEWRARVPGRTELLLRPASVEEVAAVLRIANRHGVPLVPQGGRTGLVIGGVPDDSGEEIVLSLARMNRIREVDADGFNLVAEAGVTLAAVQQAAADAGRLFPLSFGAEGTATVGGFVSTNAGGVHVLKYGTTRALVSGLEAVLPTGDILHGLSALAKDNTGYALPHLLIGAEGTLGVVTAASLKLFPALAASELAIAAVPSPAAAVRLLARMRQASGDRVIAFELMARLGVELAMRHLEGARDPLPDVHPWYVLVELAAPEAGTDLRALLEEGLAAAAEEGLVEDAAIAASLDQARHFWHMRHGLSEAQRPEGACVKHDISVPPARIPDFLGRAGKAVSALVPGVRICAFGHVGDGNLHYDLIRPEDGEDAAHAARAGELNRAVHDIVASLGGSISAEHGIGRLKREELARLKDPAALAAMRAIKRALDPAGILNPGRIFLP